MWETVPKHAKENWSDNKVSPPFSEMDLEHPRGSKERLHDENLSLNSQPSKQSKPSDLGQYIERAGTYYLPSVRNPTTPKVVDVDLQRLMATPVPWTLTPGELLKLKPKLLKGIMQNLITQGELAKDTLDQLAPTLNTILEQRVGINKVNGIRRKDEGKTTLPI